MDNDLELKRNHISIPSNIHIRNGIIFIGYCHDINLD